MTNLNRKDLKPDNSEQETYEKDISGNEHPKKYNIEQDKSEKGQF